MKILIINNKNYTKNGEEGVGANYFQFNEKICNENLSKNYKSILVNSLYKIKI